MNNYEKSSKKELLTIIENQEQIILDLHAKLFNGKDGRKSQVLDLLRSCESISILDISKKLNISTKNVSSQLTYLRTDGHQICTNPQGRKFLMKIEKVEKIDEVEKVDEVKEI